MKILLSSYKLDPSGVPTYTVTLTHALQRRGHDVTVYSPHGGKLAAQLPHVTSLEGLSPDIILAQHTPCAFDMAAAFPRVPMSYIAHGILPDIDQPPTSLPICGWIAINEQVERYLCAKGVAPSQITIIRDFIDPVRFAPLTPLTDGPPRVLFISNYKKWRNYRRLHAACEALQYPFRAVGAPYGRSRDIAADINAADLIVSWGRGILEGMSCGRCVISYDKTFGDGYLTPARYFQSRQHNFSHFEDTDGREMGVEHLIEELRQYAPADGPRNRALALRYHHVDTAIDTFLSLFESWSVV